MMQGYPTSPYPAPAGKRSLYVLSAWLCITYISRQLVQSLE
jgi:hypothetical protein